MRFEFTLRELGLQPYIFVFIVLHFIFHLYMDYCLHSVRNTLITTGDNILNGIDYNGTNSYTCMYIKVIM